MEEKYSCCETSVVGPPLTLPLMVSPLCSRATGALCSRFSSICQAMTVMLPTRSLSADLTHSDTRSAMTFFMFIILPRLCPHLRVKCSLWCLSCSSSLTENMDEPSMYICDSMQDLKVLRQILTG